MVLAAKGVKDGEADAVLSAGNTGALLAAGFSSWVVSRISTVLDLCPALPTGRVFDMLDLGANAENTAQHTPSDPSMLKMSVELRNHVLAATMEQKVVRGDPLVRATNY